MAGTPGFLALPLELRRGAVPTSGTRVAWEGSQGTGTQGGWGVRVQDVARPPPFIPVTP